MTLKYSRMTQKPKIKSNHVRLQWIEVVMYDPFKCILTWQEKMKIG